MDNQSETFPENADKLLFAEDLVSYVMTDLFNSPYEGTRATPYRRFIYNAFNENMKIAVKDLTIRVHLINADFFCMVEDISNPSENDFLELIDGLPHFQSPEGFDPKHFLLYCVEIAIIASIFRNNGLEQAPNFAVTLIEAHLEDYDMIPGGWMAINIIAMGCARLAADESNLLTPESLSSSSPERENVDDEHSFLNNVYPDGMDVALPDEMHYATAEEEMIDEDKTLADDSANAFSVDEIMDAENLQSLCLTVSKEYLQPSVAMEITMESEKERLNGTKPHEVNLKGTLISSENIGENSQLPLVSEISQTFNTFKVEFANNTISNDEISAVHVEDTLIVDKQANSDNPPKCLDESKEHENKQIFDSVEKCEKKNLSDDSCMLVASKGDSETRGSCQIPGSSSDSALRGDKVRHSGN